MDTNIQYFTVFKYFVYRKLDTNKNDTLHVRMFFSLNQSCHSQTVKTVSNNRKYVSTIKHGKKICIIEDSHYLTSWKKYPQMIQ